MKLATALLLTSAACQAPLVSHPYTPQDAADSSFQIRVSADGELSSSGTGWIVQNDDTGSLLLTAGHVCKDEGVLTFTARDRFGNDTPLDLMRVSADYDLCLLGTTKSLGPALELSQVEPAYNAPIMMVGAPQWVWGCEAEMIDIQRCGMAPISRGSYAGGTLVSMPATHGYSGSAVLTEYGVIGVLVEGYPSFSMLSFIEPLDHIREFLAKE